MKRINLSIDGFSVFADVEKLEIGDNLILTFEKDLDLNTCFMFLPNIEKFTDVNGKTFTIPMSMISVLKIAYKESSQPENIDDDPNAYSMDH